MIIRKNISLNEEYLNKLEPLLKKHNGNLSSVMREVIDLADAAFQDPDSVKRLISGLKKEQNLTSLTLMWALKNLRGKLPDDELVQNIIGEDIHSISMLEKRINELGGEIYWGLSLKISADDDILPKSASLIINGKNSETNRFLASIIAIYVSKKFYLGISKIGSMSNPFEMGFKRCDSESAIKSAIETFGSMEHAFSDLQKKSDFWSTIIRLHATMDYDMVTIPKQFFDEIMGGMPPTNTTASIEKFFGFHINQITLEELVKNMTVLYPCMGIIEKIDMDRDSLIIHHGLTRPEAIKNVAMMFVELLKLNGHTYTQKVDENLIVLRCLSDEGRIFIKLIEDLKTKEFKDYQSCLQKMLDMLRDIKFDEKLIASLGNKCGEVMIQKYEKDKAMGKWDVGNFVKYMQELSVIFKQDAKWEIFSEKIIQGKILKCELAERGDKFNIINCTFIKRIVEGSIIHAFGETTERIHKIHTGETDVCNIYVAL